MNRLIGLLRSSTDKFRKAEWSFCPLKSKATFVAFGILLVNTAILTRSLPAQLQIDRPHIRRDYNQRFLEDQLSPVVEPGLTLFVDGDASEPGDGSESKPFASLTEARDAVRILKPNEGLPASGVSVVILPGTYAFDSTFQLSEQDSGTLNLRLFIEVSNLTKLFSVAVWS